MADLRHAVYIKLTPYVFEYILHKYSTELTADGSSKDPLRPIDLGEYHPAQAALLNGLCYTSSSLAYRHGRVKNSFSKLSIREYHGRKKGLLTFQPDRSLPTDDEMRTMLGIVIPDQVPRRNCMLTVNDHWQLSEQSTIRVRNILTDEFWKDLNTFVFNYEKRCSYNNHKFVKEDAIEEFLVKNNVDLVHFDNIIRYRQRKMKRGKSASTKNETTV